MWGVFLDVNPELQDVSVEFACVMFLLALFELIIEDFWCVSKIWICSTWKFKNVGSVSSSLAWTNVLVKRLGCKQMKTNFVFLGKTYVELRIQSFPDLGGFEVGAFL